MNETQWREFLQKLSRLLLEIDLKENTLEHRLFPPQDHARGYVGFDGASETQIVAAETRLGVRLPNSYRTFLKVSNGWPLMSRMGQPGKLEEIEDTCWMRDYDPFDTKFWKLKARIPRSASGWSPKEYLETRDGTEHYRLAYIDGHLKISENGDTSYLFLSPTDLDEHGEWECWRFATWLPQPVRCDSFETWMLETYEFLSRISKS